MNRRSILAFLLVGTAAVLHAQEKAATPKPEKAEKAERADKSGDKPKVLIFQPGAKLPDAVAESGTTRAEVVQRAPNSNPMADGPAQMVANFFTSLREGNIDDG